MMKTISDAAHRAYMAFANFAADFSGRRTSPNAVRLFRKLVYAWFFLNTLILLPDARQFWGADSFVPKIDPDTVNGLPFFYLLCMEKFADGYGLFLALQLILLILGMLCIYPRLVSILIYFVTVNLDNKAYVILDGGNNLMQIMLIYLILMDPSSSPRKFKFQPLNEINNTLTNFGFIMAKLQVVMVYLVSGLGKVDGTLWQNGTALYYTLNVDEYSHPLAKALISQFPLLTVLGTYCTLAYQLSFPWLVWNRKIRPYLLAFGTFIHIQISFVMGLFMFGLAIAVSYFSFAEEAFAKKVLNVFGKIQFPKIFHRRVPA